MSNLGVTKVLVLAGTGVAGSVLITKHKLGEFLGDLSKVLSNHFKDGEKGEGEGSEASLSSQLTRLTQEIRSLAPLSRTGVTVVQGGSGSGVSSITTLFFPAAVVGVFSFGWMKWRGYSFTDLMYVTRKGMNNAVASMSKQLEHVSAGLSSTRKHLNQRLDTVDTKLDDSIVMTALIKDQVDDVKCTVGRSSHEIENMNVKLEGLSFKIDEVQDSQNFANQGISLLIEWAHRLNVVGSSPHAELAPSFKSWYQKATALEKNSNFGGAFTSPGLKQLFSDAWDPQPVSKALEMAPVMNTFESKPLDLNLPSSGMARTMPTSVLTSYSVSEAARDTK